MACQLLTLVDLDFFMPIISLLTTITVSGKQSYLLCGVNSNQLSTCTQLDLLFCRAQMYSCHFSSFCWNAEEKNILHTVCLP